MLRAVYTGVLIRDLLSTLTHAVRYCYAMFRCSRLEPRCTYALAAAYRYGAFEGDLGRENFLVPVECVNRIDELKVKRRTRSEHSKPGTKPY